MVSAEPDLPQIANNLLAYLREQLNDAGVDYRIAPASLCGGYETRMFRFQLDQAPDELSAPLVLRVFPARQPPERAIWESAVQNSLADQGYPVPRVYFAGTNAGFFGGPFVIMQFLPGETLLAAEPARAPEMLGAAHAALHKLSPEPLIDTLRERGIDDRWFRYDERLMRYVGEERGIAVSFGGAAVAGGQPSAGTGAAFCMPRRFPPAQYPGQG